VGKPGSWLVAGGSQCRSTSGSSRRANVERVFVLGIDPGLSRCGYGAVRHHRGVSTVVAGGVVATEPATPLPHRLAALHDELRLLVTEMDPDVVVVERVFFQTNARTAMATGQASGLALAVAAEHGCTVVQYTSNEVKMAVCGYGAATKAQMQHMVAQLLHLDCVPKPPDVADALALAMCHLTSMPLRQAVAAASARHPAAAASARHPAAAATGLLGANSQRHLSEAPATVQRPAP